jgi:nitrite reductase/ring-hydroxylating ferredoxin subunit
MSESLVPLCATADVPENSVKCAEAGGHRLAVYNIDGTFYVTDDECTHGAASLCDGILDDDVIECTMHFGAFDVKTGKPVQEPCSIPLRTYKVVVQDGHVFADLAKSAGE